MSDNPREILDNIEKYEIIDEDFEGMNAYAYCAWHKPLNKKVFLKIYDICEERKDIFKEPRILKEATQGDSIGVEFLVKVNNAEKINDKWVLFEMEYLEEGNLLKKLEHGPIPLMDAIEMTKGILLGLAHLHKSFFLHRDIKPANILIKKDKGKLFPKLGDFGSVARIDAMTSCVSASRHSALYVPPEGWREEKEYDVRSDLYQVGIVLGEMLNGTLPYDQENYIDKHAKKEIRELGFNKLIDLDDFNKTQIVDQAINRISNSKGILSLNRFQPYINRTLKSFINKVTNPDKNLRFGSALEILNKLNEFYFPNWKYYEDYYLALNWKEWDWKVTVENTRRGQIINVNRSRLSKNSFRKWKKVVSLDSAFREVFNY